MVAEIFYPPLGFGNAATKNVGTTAGTVAAGDAVVVAEAAAVALAAADASAKAAAAQAAAITAAAADATAKTVGKANTSDLLGVAQDTLTALAGKQDINGDVSGATVLATGAAVALSSADISIFNGINALSFVPKAALSAGSDVSGPFQQAINAARTAGRPLIVPGLASGAAFNIGTSLDISGVEIIGVGGLVSTSAAINLFVTTGPSSKVHGLNITHNGASGRVFKLDYDAHEVYRNEIRANNNSNADPLIEFSASNVHIHDNSITNLRPGALTWRQLRSDTNRISINNEIVRNYMGGTGAGGWIGDSGSAARPEGTLVAFNESVLTGGSFLTLSSVLSARIIGNMMDQAPATGALRFEPGGYNGYGIDGVLVQGNYISAPSGTGGAAIQNTAGTNGAVAGGVQIIGNEIAYGTLAANFVPGISGVFANNYMHGFSSGNAISLSAASLLSAFDFGSAKQAPNKNLVFVIGASQAGATRSTVIANYSTANGGGYCAVAHGLAAIPTKFRIAISVVGTGGAAITGASPLVAAADTANITLAVNVAGIVAHGTLFITVDSEI